MTPRRILVVADAYPSRSAPGANAFIRSQAVALARLECDVAVLAPTPWVPSWLGKPWRRFATLPNEELDDQIRVCRPRFPRAPGAWFRPYASPVQTFWVRKAFETMLCQHRPDIVHAHMATPAGFVAVSLAKRMGVPCCLTLHGLDVTDYPRSSKTIGRQTEWTLRSADRVIAVSRYIASAAASLARSERPIQVCYIGVDLQKFKPDLERRAAVRRQLGVADHVQILCLAARMVREKGGDVFSAAVAEVSRRGLDVAALLIGAGPKSDRLIASLVDRLGRHRVFAVRDIPNERMADYFAAADLLLHPSLEEGFGMVLLEAQACGLPIIAIDVGGVREAVDAGRSAWLLPAQASEGKLALALADAVGDLLLGRERMSQMARLGREFAVRNFEIGYCTQKLIRIYDELRSQ